MKRNENVKNNADNMLLEIMKYLHASHISEKEFTIICLELASTCIAASVAFNPDNYENERHKVVEEITTNCVWLCTEIIKGIDKSVANNDIKAQFKIKGE